MTKRQQLEQAISTLKAQRSLLGDAVVETALAPLYEKLATLEGEPHTEQRKQVTVMFADLSGFTALAEILDAEEVRDLINALWAPLDAVITQQGGIIDKHMGDAVMALFGAPVAQEDDPERAIRAALAMQQVLLNIDLGSLCPNLPQLQLGMRIGLNTGPVLLGSVGANTEYTAMGDTVNLASRLEHACPVGGILISHETYRHVRGIFDVEALSPLLLKGKTEPAQVYLIKGAKARAFRVSSRGVEGIETRMVGRTQELSTLQQCLANVIAQQQMQVVTVVGEAGLGKSRLLYEFDNWLELSPAKIRFFKGRASPQMSRLPYSLIRDLFAARFAILDSDRAQVARNKLVQGIAEFMGPESQEKAPFIGQLLGLDFSASPHLRGILADARQIRDRAFHYTAQLFQGAAGAQCEATVLFLDDIHWGDDGSLDLLEYLAQECRHSPLLLVLVARPTLFDRRPQWCKGLLRLQLHPLSKSESSELVLEILKKVPEIPNSLQELIVTGADGNPFYVEELIKKLIDDGIIIKGPHQWHVVAEQLAHIRLPPTLMGILQARLDSLPLEEREVLQRASVVGRVFWDSAVAALHGPSRHQGSDLVTSSELLGSLRERELVFGRDTTAFAGAREYIFKHAILRDVTYESVLKKLRRIYHKQVAQWLLTRSGERVLEYAGLIGEHFEQAQDRENAALWYRQAAEVAQNAYANDSAIDYYQRLLLLLTEPEQAEVLLKLGGIWQLMGKWSEAEEVYHRALALAQDLDHQKIQAQGRRAIGDIQRLRGFHEAALIWMEQAKQGFEALEDLEGISRTVGNMGSVYVQQGDFNRALVYYEQQLRIASECNDRRSVSMAVGNIGVVYGEQGDYQRALACYQQQLRIATELSDRRWLGLACGNMGNLYLYQGNYPRALECYTQQLQIAREIGDRYGVSLAIGNIGIIFLEQGDYPRALQCYAQKLAIASEIGDRNNIGLALGNMAEVYMLQQQYNDAERLCSQAIVLSANIPSYLSIFLCIHAEVALYQANYEVAEHFCKEALQIATQIEDNDIIFKVKIIEIRLQVICKKLSVYEALDKFKRLLESTSEAIQQAGLYYEIWRLDDLQLHAAQTAANLYKDLYLSTSKVEYRQRYEELTGQALNDTLPLPELSDLVIKSSLDIAELLQRVETLLAQQLTTV